MYLTICTFQRRDLFGVVRREGRTARVELTTVGDAVREEWAYHVARLCKGGDAFVIMPNHLHGIVRLGKCRLAAFVGAFKASVSSRTARENDDGVKRVWERGYYDRAIRTHTELQAMREYIAANPMRWLP